MRDKPTSTKRNIRSFEAADDVTDMLKRAEAEGVKLVWLCNNALRDFLTKKGYSRKRDAKA